VKKVNFYLLEESMKKGITIFILLIIYSLSFAATISGNAIDTVTNSGVSEITIYLQRTNPNPWENLYYTYVTDEYGYFEMTEVLTGEYRIYTSWNEDYFAGYYQNYLHITTPDQYMGEIIVDMQPVLTTRGSISGLLISNNIPLDNTFFAVQLKHYVAPGEMEITMGFVEPDEEGYFEYDDLNLGQYKVGLFFYGEFNGEIWFDGVLSEDEATLVEITAENPAVTDLDFNFTHESLNSSYVVIDEVIVDYGWDEQLDFGETIEFSLILKNIGSQPAMDNSFAIRNYYQDYVEMDHIYQQIGYLAPQEELIVGPFQFTVGNDVPDGVEFNFWYLYYGENNTVQTPIPFLINAPELNFVDYSIYSNDGGIVADGVNSATVSINNTGHSWLNYPIVQIFSDDSEVFLESDFYTNYYVIPSDGFVQDFYFDFMINESNLDDYQLEFYLKITNLAGNFEDEIPFVIDLVLPTDAPEDVVNSVDLNLINYPNPFNPETTISFQLEELINSKLTIYDAVGKKVKSYDEKDFRINNGKYEVYWNGRDESGKPVASGIYLYKLKNSRYTATKKMILLK